MDTPLKNSHDTKPAPCFQNARSSAFADCLVGIHELAEFAGVFYRHPSVVSEKGHADLAHAHRGGLPRGDHFHPLLFDGLTTALPSLRRTGFQWGRGASQTPKRHEISRHQLQPESGVGNFDQQWIPLHALPDVLPQPSQGKCLPGNLAADGIGWGKSSASVSAIERSTSRVQPITKRTGSIFESLRRERTRACTSGPSPSTRACRAAENDCPSRADTVGAPFNCFSI